MPILSNIWRRIALCLDYSNIYEKSGSQGRTLKPPIRILFDEANDQSMSHNDGFREGASHRFHNLPLGQK